ncbi:hypothetical protein JOD24_001567 [Kroppenstedtia sanguinis]
MVRAVRSNLKNELFIVNTKNLLFRRQLKVEILLQHFSGTPASFAVLKDVPQPQVAIALGL